MSIESGSPFQSEGDQEPVALESSIQRAIRIVAGQAMKFKEAAELLPLVSVVGRGCDIPAR